MTERGITPFQTIGPFFSYCLTPEPGGLRGITGADLVTPDMAGTRITIAGRVLDGDGAPLSDAVLEIWQADGDGRYPEPGRDDDFRGFGRCETDAQGGYAFTTVKPGRVQVGPLPGGASQAPHVAMSVFARGLLVRLATRIYFADEDGNAADPVLALVPAERRATLIAARRPEAGVYRFDVRLQGDGETVFFEI